MSKPSILETIHSFTSIEQALDYFEIGFTQTFIDENRTQIVKLFSGYLIMTKPDDWFSARKALKNAYCKTQRSLLSQDTRQACKGCTTCQRR